MFEKLKQLFKKPAPAPVVSQPVPAAPAPAAPAKAAAPSAPPPPPKPAAPAAAGAPAPAPAPPTAARTATGDELAIPLQAIVEKLPPTLARKVASPNETLLIPKKLVTQQLPSGAVKLAFGDLRRLAPAGALLEAGDDDQKLVEIPLSEILPRLSPADFGRRTDQRVIEIPDDVAGLFGPKGEPVTPPKSTVIGVAPVETPGQKPVPAPAPQPKAAPATPAAAPAPKPAAAPAPSPAVAKAPPAAPPPPAPKPAEPAGPLKVSSDLLQQMAAAAGTAAPKPAAPQPAPAPAAPAPAPAPAAAPAAPQGMVAVPVAAVSANWPEEIKAEIQQFKLAEGSLLVPVDEMSKALKTGKVAYSWSQLLAWTNPSLKSKSGNVTVELALKVVAPLFLAVSKLPAPKKKVEVDPNIPDMFVGKGAAAAATAPSPPAPAPAPPAVPAPAPAPAVAPQPSLASAPAPAPSPPALAVRTPEEVVKAVIRLPGVAGAVVASEDGLSVAAQVLPPLEKDKVAAFAPQLYQRIAQYSRDLGAGVVEDLAFTCNGAAWRVRKCGKVYLTVVSQPQRTLPLTELAQLERELSKM